MKKDIVILMAIDILIGLAACTSAPQADASAQGTTATETKQTEQTDTKDTSADTSSAIKPLVIGTS